MIGVYLLCALRFLHQEDERRQSFFLYLNIGISTLFSGSLYTLKERTEF